MTTLSYKISVMLAFHYNIVVEETCPITGKWIISTEPTWDWVNNKYRVKDK